MAEKMRVHILAKELNVPSKAIIEKCRAEGIDTVKNHMSTLTAGLHASIREWFSEASSHDALETAKPVDLKKTRISPRRAKAKTTAPPASAVEESPPVAVAEPSTAAPLVAEVSVPPAPVVAPEPAAPEPPEAASEVPEVVAEAETVEPTPAPEIAEVAEAVEAPSEPDAAPSPEPEIVAEAPAEGEPVAEATPEVAEEEAPDAEHTPEERPKPRKPVKPAGPQHVPAPAKLQGPRVVRYEAPERDLGPIRRRPPAAKREESIDLGDSSPPPPIPAEPGKQGAASGRRRRINPRRAAGTLRDAGERLAEWRDQDLQERKERLAGATGRRISRHRTTAKTTGGAQKAATGPKTQARVQEPVRIKEFCSETGVNFMQVFKVLRNEHNLMANINMTLPTETAQLLALEFGIELTVVPAKTLLDVIEDEFAQRERKNPQPRPPVVAMLGHVDHGKTSLLDAVRRTRVAAGEDGGITQHISSYHLETAHGAVTFLDTPGHEAFTAMRARGAQITDVVVLVVAADDGIMPQTIEAIHHAQAAEVPIVVALNKIDLGDDNKLKIFGQLAELGLTPSGEWGGEVDVLETSATTGQGVTELVEHLAELSGLLELKADPTIPATGTVIEAETKMGVGSVIRVLIQDGTLRVGDFVACGGAAGKVRALLNDSGQRIQEAGPALPVEVWGLDDVPISGDRLYQVESLQRAKEIAEETKQVRVESSRQQTRKARTLQDMLQQRTSDEIPELNAIIKADVDGSLAALRQSLGDLPSDEVRLTIRHSAVGAVSDSDILLAAACDGIVVAYRVDVSTGARRLADEHGVDVRPYKVIYDVCDDVKKALEGLLAPEESIERRATAEVREVFRLSRRGGVIAGSFVTDGVVNRNHFAKIIRDGVIIRDETKIASLRRFKDDAKEVRQGMECGIRIEDFDDLHVGDIVETYEIVKTARTL